MPQITTSDQIWLNAIEAGSGTPLVFIPGWSQSAAMFRYQLEDLSRDYRVIAIDMRGHGQSEKPAHGYRIARLAADLHDALQALDLKGAILAGHSMGCSIIWSYLDQFGSDRLSRLILIDEPPVLTAWPSWTEAERLDLGPKFTPELLFGMADELIGPTGKEFTRNFITGNFFTKAISKEMVEWVVAENLKFPRLYAARLLIDHGAQDWRDTVARIALPTMVVGGEASVFKVASQKWIARQALNARLEIFNEKEGGSHFMWLENPERFNSLVRSFAG